MKRGLWGLLLVGMVLSSGRAAGKAPTGVPAPAAVTVTQVHIAPFAAPSTMPALGEELARGLYAVLRDANIPARLGKADDGSVIVGRLEEISQAQVRLHASYRGHSVQSVGDLEHLDDLLFAVFTQLRPRLQATADNRSGTLVSPSDAYAVAPDSILPAPPTVNTSSASTAKATPRPSDPDTAVRLASVKDVSSNPTGRPSSRRPTETRPTALPPAPPIPADPPAQATREPSAPSVSGYPKETVLTSVPPSLPSPPTVTSEPLPEPPPRMPPIAPPPSKNPLVPRPALAPFTFDTRRPRIAVHVVGDPLTRIPAGYAGLGAVGQQSLISYLQQRLRIPAVASRLTGLTDGMAALDQSLRVGARHTLMVRLDGLSLSASPGSGPMPGPMGSVYGGGTLSGRIHIVLLLDGRLLLDRSVMLPPALVLPAETPAQAYSRSLMAAMDAVAGELAGRLTAPSPLAVPTGNPGLPRSP